MIYADNSATSFYKPPKVIEAISNYLKTMSANPGRSGHSLSINSMREVYKTREILSQFFNNTNPAKVIFTSNATMALNTVIRGLFSSKDHVLISPLEHNSVMRPLNDINISYSKIPVDDQGYINFNSIEKLLQSNTKAIILNHASNVCGCIQKIEEIKKIKEKHDLIFILDASQSAGLTKIDIIKNSIDILCFTGHKYLFGPQGVGGFILNDNFDFENLNYLISGGSGSKSEEEVHPLFLPDKYEAGTLNTPAIFALNEALKYINEITIEKIEEYEKTINSYFIERLLNIEKISFYGPKIPNNRTSTFSLNIKGIDPGELTYILDNDYQIMTRPGLHCSPSSHKTLGTFPYGSLRISFCYHNTIDDIDKIIIALNKICSKIT